MDDTSSSSRAMALAAARLLEDHGGDDTLVLRVGGVCTWTDYFVIVTAHSATHLRSLLDHVLDLLKQRSVAPLNPTQTQRSCLVLNCSSPRTAFNATFTNWLSRSMTNVKSSKSKTRNFVSPATSCCPA